MTRLPLLALFLLAASPAAAAPPKLPAMPELEFAPPKGTRVALPNGMLLYLLENRELPVIQGAALIRTGSAADPADPPVPPDGPVPAPAPTVPPDPAALPAVPPAFDFPASEAAWLPQADVPTRAKNTNNKRWLVRIVRALEGV